MEPRRYDTDLTDDQYALVEPLLPQPKKMGRPPADLRAVLGAILYLVRTGCPWRLLPHDFPPSLHRPHLVPPLAARRHLGEDPRVAAAKGPPPGPPRSPPAPQGRPQPVRPDHAPPRAQRLAQPAG